MVISGVGESVRTSWLQRPLCRRYAGAVFSTTTLPLKDSHADRKLSCCWALGTLRNGEQDVLGAWKNSNATGGMPPEAFGELHTRGAEFIEIAIGDCVSSRSECVEPFRRVVFMPSVEQALESLGALLPPRHREPMLGSLRQVAAADGLDAASQQLREFQGAALGERYPSIIKLWCEALARFEPLYALPAPLRQLVRLADRTAMEVHEHLTRAIHRHGPFADQDAALDFVAGFLLRAEQRLDRARAVSLPVLCIGSTPSRTLLPRANGLGVPTLA